MMYVFGEVQDPLTETTQMMEDVVRGQLTEIVCRILCGNGENSVVSD